MFAFRFQDAEQMSMSLSLSHINGTFTTGILECPPRPQHDQGLDNLDGCTAMSGMVKRGIQGRPSRACGVDERWVPLKRLKHLRPFVRFGSVSKVVADSCCLFV